MAFDLDVLIIGGGIQGMWLLKDLAHLNYSAFLVTNRAIGVGQTLHSHGYIHAGYLYSELELAKRLNTNEVVELWDHFMGSSGITRPNLRPMFGFTRGMEELLLRRWRSARLPYYLGQLPSEFEGGIITGVFNTNEYWVDVEQVVRHLSRDVGDLVRMGRVERITMNQGGQREVKVVIENTDCLLKPRLVVLAAGVGNSALLKLMAQNDESLRNRIRSGYGDQGPQRIRRSQMLVLKGRTLPAFACIFPHLNMFVVPRTDGSDNIWLVSHDTDQEVQSSQTFIGDSDPPVDSARLRRTIAALRAVAPTLFQRDVTWGAYTGFKGEGRLGIDLGRLPKEEVIEDFEARDLIAVWPTKLTLAPKASKEIVRRIAPRIVPGRGRFDASAFGVPQQTVLMGREKWKSAELIGWAEFKRLHSIA